MSKPGVRSRLHHPWSRSFATHTYQGDANDQQFDEDHALVPDGSPRSSGFQRAESSHDCSSAISTAGSAAVGGLAGGRTRARSDSKRSSGDPTWAAASVVSCDGRRTAQASPSVPNAVGYRTDTSSLVVMGADPWCRCRPRPGVAVPMRTVDPAVLDPGDTDAVGDGWLISTPGDRGHRSRSCSLRLVGRAVVRRRRWILVAFAGTRAERPPSRRTCSGCRQVRRDPACQFVVRHRRAVIVSWVAG